jgi:hypothetical protein
MSEPIDAYFLADGDELRPVPEARSPWSADMLHGRFLAGLGARAAEADDHDPELRLARLTVDMFRSPPMTPLTVTSSVVRAGKRVRLIDVSIRAERFEVARACALLLRTGQHPDVQAWQPQDWNVPAPESLPQPGTGDWDIRLISPGGFWTSERKLAWTRDTWQLVAGEAVTPVVRAALAADLPNPLANGGAGGLKFINPDLTMFLSRPPISEWIGLEVTNHLGDAGVAVGSCTLHDTAGPFGASVVCAIANESTLSSGAPRG